jgi:hypothetical protein
MLERTHFTIERTHSIQNTFYMCAGGSINNRRKPGGRSFSCAASPCLNGVSPPLPPPPAVAPSIHLIRRFASNKAFLLLPLLLPPPSLPPPLLLLLLLLLLIIVSGAHADQREYALSLPHELDPAHSCACVLTNANVCPHTQVINLSAHSHGPSQAPYM